MIWRLPHPVRGLVAAWLTFMGLCVLLGFGVGTPELAIMLVACGWIFWAVASRPTAQDDPPA